LSLVPALPDLRQCAEEPIHLASAIQPHGALLSLAPPSLRITRASVSCERLLGVAATELLERPLETALGAALADAVRAALVDHAALPDVPASLRWQSPRTGLAFAGYVHRSEGLVVVELEPEIAPQAARGASPTLLLVSRTSRTIRAHGDVPGKARAACEALRLVTGFERVMVYRFHRDGHGEVIAESCRAELEPYLGLHYPESDIPAQARRMLVVCPIREIVDVDAGSSPILPEVTPGTRPLDLSCSMLRSAAPVHLSYLRNMGVRASLTASLLCNGKLWGLIACHDAGPHRVSCEAREFAGWLAQNLASEITITEEQGARSYAAHLKQCREVTLASMREGARLATMLGGPELADILGAVGADGVALVRAQEVVTGGVAPEPPQVLEIAARLRQRHADTSTTLFATERLSEHMPELADARTTAAGLVVFSLPGQDFTLMWFRGEWPRSVTWGGDPHKAANASPDGQIHPRQSFQAWTQSVRLRSRPWRAEELESAHELRAAMEIELRRTMETTLARERKRYQTLMSVARDGIHVLDLDGRLVEANDAFLAMIGQPRERVGLLNVSEWDKALPEAEVPRALRATVARVGGGVFESRHHRPDGSSIDVEISAGGVELDGQTFVLATSRDISARKQLEQERLADQAQLQALNLSLQERVEQAVAEIRAKDQILIIQGRQAAMGEMIGNIAHQWRQPLNALGLLIANARDASRAGELDQAAVEEAAAHANRLIQSMSKTISDFRNFLTPGRKKTVFSARAELVETLRLVDASYRHDGIELVLEGDSDVSLLGFPNEYAQVVLNLLSNARQAIQASKVTAGRITLWLESRGDLGCLVVRDNGGGIPEAVLGRIFEPYFTTRQTGSGIGLTMSRQIVEQSMGGRLEARNVGDGAELTVLLPLAVGP
jgi:PAS domain S-box-containing protein